MSCPPRNSFCLGSPSPWQAPTSPVKPLPTRWALRGALLWRLCGHAHLSGPLLLAKSWYSPTAPAQARAHSHPKDGGDGWARMRESREGQLEPPASRVLGAQRERRPERGRAGAEAGKAGRESAIAPRILSQPRENSIDRSFISMKISDLC